MTQKTWKDFSNTEKVVACALLALLVSIIVGFIFIMTVVSTFNKPSVDKQATPVTTTNTETKPTPIVQEDPNSITKKVGEIQASKDASGTCNYSDERNDYLSIKLAMQDATTNFINLGKKIDFALCTSFIYTLRIPLVDSRGNETMSPIVTFIIDQKSKPVFDSYKWDNLEYAEIYSQLNRDEMIYNIKLLVDGVNVEYVRYMGASDKLKL